MKGRFLHLSIGTRIFIAIGLVYILSSIVIVILVNRHMRRQGVAHAEAKSRTLLDRNLAAHTCLSKELLPNLFNSTDPVRQEEYFEPGRMSSNYAVRKMPVFTLYGDTDYDYKKCFLNARTSENEADDLEKTFLEELNRDPELKDLSFVRMKAGRPMLVTLGRGETMEEGCPRCQGTPDRAPGELAAYGPVRSFHGRKGEVVPVISVRVPLTEVYDKAERFSLQLAGGLLVMFIVVSFAHFWLNRRFIVVPLLNIRAKALQVTGSTRHLGEEIPVPSGGELAKLTTAFNTMSRGLSHSRKKLEENVRERTADLTHANERLEKELLERKRMERSLQEYSVRLEEMVHERTEKLKEAQEKLVRRDKLAVLGQLAGGVAHDLRTPLGVIKNVSYFLDMVLTDCEDDVKEMLGLLNKEVGKSNSIINSLLDFARPKSPVLKQVKINEILLEAVSTARMLDGPDVAIESLLDEKLPILFNDPDQLGRVFDNLIKNAIQAMPEGGTLTVRSEKTDPDWVAVSVTDTGTGISRENLTKIFEPLVTTKDHGIGLGLVITKSLVETNGGTIEVDSKLGKGSTFTVRLPLGRKIDAY